jgi:hypothetical protein
MNLLCFINEMGTARVSSIRGRTRTANDDVFCLFHLSVFAHGNYLRSAVSETIIYDITCNSCSFILSKGIKGGHGFNMMHPFCIILFQYLQGKSSASAFPKSLSIICS